MEFKRSLIKQTDIFKNLKESNIIYLAEIARILKLKKNEILFFENDPGRAVYVCLKGNIQLYKSNDDGREIVVKLIKPEEVFAEVILFEMDHYPVYAKAVGPSEVLEIPKNELMQLFDNLNFRNDFIGMLMQKQRYLVEKIRYLSTTDVEDRLYAFIKEMYGDASEIKINLSKKDVASAIGTVPETLSRALARLKSDGKISWENNVITISPEWKHNPQI